MKIGQKIFIIIRSQKNHLYITDLRVISFDKETVILIDTFNDREHSIFKLQVNEIFEEKGQAELVIRAIKEKREDLLIHNKVHSILSLQS